MVLEQDILPYWQWLFGGGGASPALFSFLYIALAIGVGAIVIGYLIAAVIHGPVKGGDTIYRIVVGGLKELPRISPRRVFALARLTTQESMRRRVWVVLVVFIVFLALASWFMGSESAEPARLVLSVVSWTITLLIIGVSIFLSAFSLPTDIKNKTIHTVVTKPVYPSEIVLGRILGFVAVGTVLLAAMAALGYVFVVNQIGHTHTVAQIEVPAKWTPGATVGRTSTDSLHEHDLRIDSEGNLTMEARHGHRHKITATGPEDDPHYEIGPPEDMFFARVPNRGKLRWYDRLGHKTDRGVNVGDEWQYRSFIEGGTEAAAVWTFEGVTPEAYPRDKFPDGLPLELNVRVFRTWKGKIVDEDTGRVKGISGVVSLRNPLKDPNTGQQISSELIGFEAKDQYIDRKDIPWELKDSRGNTIDLMKDLVHDGKVEVWIQCNERGQFFGFAQADVYLHASDRPFTLNYIKGYISIWTVMVWVIGCGVMISTLVNGSVAMLFTLGLGLIGIYHEKIYEMLLKPTPTGRPVGGGPLESLIRDVTQMNMISPLSEGTGTTIIQTIDTGLLKLIEGWLRVIPDLNHLNSSRFVADGFDISGDLLAQQITISLAYAVGMFIVGYFLLRTREVAK